MLKATLIIVAMLLGTGAICIQVVRQGENCERHGGFYYRGHCLPEVDSSSAR